MSNWRKFFVVMLLALSLPAQSFAAVSMKYVALQGRAHDAAPSLTEHLRQAGHPEMQVMASAADSCHIHHLENKTHAYTCSACGSCCTGVALMPTLTVVPPALAARLLLPAAAFSGAVSFLTGGIERPPRPSLV